MSDSNITLIKDIKPFMNNLTIECMIVKYIDDPPDHINNVEKYHYRVADKSGSAILCIPHFFIENELKKNKVDEYLHQDIEDMVDNYDPSTINFNENIISIMKEKYNKDIDRGFESNKKESNPIKNVSSRGMITGNSLNKNETVGYSSVNNMYNSRVDSGFFLTSNTEGDKSSEISNSSTKKILKYFFRIGDQIKIYGAITTWSMGKMVLMPSTRTSKNRGDRMGEIYRIGFFDMKISIEPNVSNLISGTTEKKYKTEERSNTNTYQKESNFEEENSKKNMLNAKMSKDVTDDVGKDDMNKNVNTNIIGSGGEHLSIKKKKKSKYDVTFLL